MGNLGAGLGRKGSMDHDDDEARARLDAIRADRLEREALRKRLKDAGAEEK